MTCKSNILTKNQKHTRQVHRTKKKNKSERKTETCNFIRGSWTEWDQNVRARRRSCLQKIAEEKKKHCLKEKRECLLALTVK